VGSAGVRLVRKIDGAPWQRIFHRFHHKKSDGEGGLAQQPMNAADSEASR